MSPTERVGAQHADGGARSQWRLVLGKELGDLLGRLGSKPLTRTIGVVVLFGLLVPQRFPGLSYLPAFFALFMAFLPARLAAVESYAGERERGTLEPLLASPLADRSIAIGKILAAAVYGTLRSWLFVAVWLPATAALELLGIGAAPLPTPGVVLGALAGAVLVATAAALFGVWQSAQASSVRAVLESGGLVRLVVVLGLFFVGPWLLGLLDPAGQAPRLPLPGSEAGIAAPSAAALTGLDPGALTVAAALAALVGAGVLWALLRATLRRCQRERLALVTAGDARQ